MYLKVRVIENRSIGHPAQGIFRLVLSGQAAKIAKPGQFLHIQVSDTYDPLLRRPLSIAGIDKNKEEITIYYKLLGRGTDLLTHFKENDYLSIMGPLGSEFTVPQQGELLLIAGGIGIFPLYSLIQAIDQEKVKIHLLWGGENIDFLESADLKYLVNSGVNVKISTMDGSLGHKGLVTDLLQEMVQDSSMIALRCNNLVSAACGPKGMLKATAEICLNNDIPLEVSLEERMACGIGACLGCVCTVRGADGTVKRKRVCKEGPVFRAKEVVWDAEC
ncbi:MAG: Dihydroorotate dehydrogenase B (NAD(+)), electron transfer subunit [Candidatus Dichloromethanomonas elyunquensis]|nr:MAG: Dihydroorotate dehydrogenase B (NAD(+)), electron transfer subunit [Candidatus Dichloromethanomonas elyunquensis]